MPAALASLMAASCRAKWRNGLIPILEERYVNLESVKAKKILRSVQRYYWDRTAS